MAKNKHKIEHPPFALVRITKASKDTYWYANKIGTFWIVEDVSLKTDYSAISISSNNWLFQPLGAFIAKSDCEIILSKPIKGTKNAK